MNYLTSLLSLKWDWTIDSKACVHTKAFMRATLISAGLEWVPGGSRSARPCYMVAFLWSHMKVFETSFSPRRKNDLNRCRIRVRLKNDVHRTSGRKKTFGKMIALASSQRHVRMQYIIEYPYRLVCHSWSLFGNVLFSMRC